MSDRTQDLKNLRAVATACKNYVDETKEQILWQVGQYNITTQDDNTTAYQKVVPTGATRCKIKRIYGLTQKLNPTTASDSTSYSVKTMPATVYDFDISKVEGNSEKSENLLNESNFNNVVPSTQTFSNGVLTSSGIDSRDWNNYDSCSFKFYLTAGTYQLKLFDRNITTNQYQGGMFVDSNNQSVANIGTIISNTSGNTSITISTSGYYGFKLKFIGSFKPMLVSGSTAPTEYKAGFTGIHNFEWNGVVVKNSDDEVMQNISIDLSSITYNDSPLFEGNSLKGVGSVADEITPYKATKRMGRVKAKDLSWNYLSGYGFNATINNSKFNQTVGIFNVYKDNFTANATTASTMYGRLNDKEYCWYSNNSVIFVRDDSYTDTTTFKNHFTDDDYIQYELADTIEVSINWASFLRGITGYSNGTISLLNTNNQDTANLITYNSIIKENCCAKMVQSRGGNVIKTVTFPTQASDGYSAVSVANVRDFTTNKRGTNVSKNIFTNNEETYTRSVAGSLNGYQIVKNNSNWKNGTLNAVEDFDITVGDSYSSEHYSLATNRFNISFNASRGIDTGEKAKQYIGGRIFYYELADASKTETDITAIENVIEVEPNDVLSFYNSDDELVTIPSDLTYRIEVAR